MFFHWIQQQSQHHRCALGCSCEVPVNKSEGMAERWGGSSFGVLYASRRRCHGLIEAEPPSRPHGTSRWNGRGLFSLCFTELLVPRRPRAHGSLPRRETCHYPRIAPTAWGPKTINRVMWDTILISLNGEQMNTELSVSTIPVYPWSELECDIWIRIMLLLCKVDYLFGLCSWPHRIIILGEDVDDETWPASLFV